MTGDGSGSFKFGMLGTEGGTWGLGWEAPVVRASTGIVVALSDLPSVHAIVDCDITREQVPPLSATVEPVEDRRRWCCAFSNLLLRRPPCAPSALSTAELMMALLAAWDAQRDGSAAGSSSAGTTSLGRRPLDLPGSTRQILGPLPVDWAAAAMYTSIRCSSRSKPSPIRFTASRDDTPTAGAGLPSNGTCCLVVETTA